MKKSESLQKSHNLRRLTMKFIVVLLAALVAFTCDVKGYHDDEILQKCMAENGVSENDSTNTTGPAELDHNKKCVHACVLRELKLTNKNGTLSEHKVDLLMALLKHQLGEIKECFDNYPHHKDKCDASYELDGCLRKTGLVLHGGKNKNEKPAEKDVETK